MKRRIAINGFGRIGRLSLKFLLENDQVEVVAVNDLADNDTLIHLLKYDSIHGRFPSLVEATAKGMRINGHEIVMTAERNPELLPWKELNVDLVLECTGIFRSADKLQMHLTAGAKKVILSAPAKGEMKTVVLGVNEEILNADDVFVSNASCTTNCLAPMAKVLHEHFGIVKGYMTTVHAYTADQNLQDAPHKDLRRARAAALSIVPTTTGAAKSVGLVLPELKGKLDGIALRVPTATGSITDLSVVLAGDTTVEEINAAMRRAAEGRMKGILEYTEDEIVSADIVGHPASCIFDAKLTSVQGNLVKVCGWYDNEAGYAARMADLAVHLAKM
jgi:glyceraldehyde 3-phosphate dehydrogenase